MPVFSFAFASCSPYMPLDPSPFPWPGTQVSESRQSRVILKHVGREWHHGDSARYGDSGTWKSSSFRDLDAGVQACQTQCSQLCSFSAFPASLLSAAPALKGSSGGGGQMYT